jgi:hypothetical protein
MFRGALGAGTCMGALGSPGQCSFLCPCCVDGPAEHGHCEAREETLSGGTLACMNMNLCSHFLYLWLVNSSYVCETT